MQKGNIEGMKGIKHLCEQEMELENWVSSNAGFKAKSMKWNSPPLKNYQFHMNENSNS